jgi:hypothetical protein
MRVIADRAPERPVMLFMSHCNPRIQLPATHVGLIDLIRALVPLDADPEKTFAVFMELVPHEGEVMQKSVVKETIADCFGTYVSKWAWPVGWRRVDLM